MAKLDEISLPEKMPWIEKLAFPTAHPVEIENPHDDLKREAELYVPTLLLLSCYSPDILP